MRINNKQFELYVNEYSRLIISVCLSFTKNYFDAEDLAQETFLSAYKNFDAFDGKNIKAWLTAIAANKCRDYLKSPARRVTSLSPEDFDCIEDVRGSPEEEAVKSDAAQRVRLLCNRLKEPYRSVAAGYFCYGIKLSEMAAKSGENLKTLETRLYRAKKLLKVMWREEIRNEQMV